MEQIKLNLNEKNQGAFVVLDGDEQLGEMVIAIVENDLIVYHTEVSPKAEGKGFAKLMLNEMVAYAREKGLKVIPLCPYVHAQFKRYPADYDDIWNKIHENE